MAQEIQGGSKVGVAPETRAVHVAGVDAAGLVQNLLLGADGSLTGSGTHGSTIIATGMPALHEAKDFDNAVFPNVVTEGQFVRPASSLYGVGYQMLTSESGDQSPYDSIDNALNIKLIGHPLNRYQNVEVQPATVVTAAETTIGGNIPTAQFNTLVVMFDYSIGDETLYELIPYAVAVAGGDEHQFGEWTVGGTKTLTPIKFSMTTSTTGYFMFNVTGIPIVVVKGDATGGTPNGTVQLTYILSNN